MIVKTLLILRLFQKPIFGLGTVSVKVTGTLKYFDLDDDGDEWYIMIKNCYYVSKSKYKIIKSIAV